ncbi:phage tail terminator protein [Pseudomonas plecoglossicida]|uniref:phage tail terminator protein n=1 Tax=Pseudomonas plecoglossicida TaxID=70775 RepID=UPI003D201D61
MKISPIIAHLRENCPSLVDRVSGGIDLDAVSTSVLLKNPSAYVIAADDKAGDNQAQNAVIQDIEDRFEVVLAMDTKDERGQQASDLLHDFRKELWRALVGWRPSAEYEPIIYDGGGLVLINRARVVYRFSFSAGFRLGRNKSTDPAETWHEHELDGLPAFTGATIDMDCIDPADRNLQYPGPDGRIEATFSGDPEP